MGPSLKQSSPNNSFLSLIKGEESQSWSVARTGLTVGAVGTTPRGTPVHRTGTTTTPRTATTPLVFVFSAGVAFDVFGPRSTTLRPRHLHFHD